MERLGPAPGRLGRAAQTARRLTYHSDSRADRRKTAGLSRPAPLSLRGCRSVPPNGPGDRCRNHSSVLRTEDLTVRSGGLPTINRVTSEASETKGLALAVIAADAMTKARGSA